MKYIKTYENVGEQLWIVIYDNFDFIGHNFQKLFNDKESAENFFIAFANEKKYDDYTRKKRNFDENDYLLSVEDTYKWLGSEIHGFDIKYESIEVLGKFELSDDIKRLRNVKKYNL